MNWFLDFLKHNAANFFWAILICVTLYGISDDRAVILGIADPNASRELSDDNAKVQRMDIDGCEYIIILYRGKYSDAIGISKTDCDCIPAAIQRKNAKGFDR